MAITQKLFGTTPEGRNVNKYIMQNKNGMEVHFIDYGCRITNLFYPGAKNRADVVLGFNTLEEYLADSTFQGAFVGRYANRIENAEFNLNGLTYKLTKTDGENYLHGDFASSIFSAGTVGENTLALTLASPEGTGGFPGEVWACVTYTLTDENELVMDFSAAASADTPINLTNHSYFNLAGAGKGDICGHQLQIFSSYILEIKQNLCPTGKKLAVKGTPMDFGQPKLIGQDINAAHPQLQLAGGYDHCFIIEEKNKKWSLAAAAEVTHPESGRKMRVFTTQPAVQFYSGNFLNGQANGKNGSKMEYRSGFCLETQHYPSSPTQPQFPSTIIKKGKKYRQIAVYAFG